jgi:hypothetical protein
MSSIAMEILSLSQQISMQPCFLTFLGTLFRNYLPSAQQHRPSKKTLLRATKGEQLHLLGEAGIWNSERKEICKPLSFEELMALVS